MGKYLFNTQRRSFAGSGRCSHDGRVDDRRRANTSAAFSDVAAIRVFAPSVGVVYNAYERNDYLSRLVNSEPYLDFCNSAAT